MSTPAANANATEIGQSDQVSISFRKCSMKNFTFLLFDTCVTDFGNLKKNQCVKIRKHINLS